MVNILVYLDLIVIFVVKVALSLFIILRKTHKHTKKSFTQQNYSILEICKQQVTLVFVFNFFLYFDLLRIDHLGAVVNFKSQRKFHFLIKKESYFLKITNLKIKRRRSF